MSGRRCCAMRAASGGPHTPSLPRRGAKAAGWVLPSAVMVLMPKCPMCVAAYVAMVSGVGISMTAAAELRVGVLAACGAVLTYCAAKMLLSRAHAG